METTVDLKALTTALRVTAPAVARSGANRNVLLETAGTEALRLSTTDGGLTIRTIVPATTASPGATLVEHSLIKGLAKGKGSAVLEDDGENLIFRNSATSTLARRPLDEFQTNTPARIGGHVHVVDVEALASVLVAASDDGARPVLNTVAFQDALMVATDSYRLHVVEVPGQRPVDHTCLVPADVLRAVLKVVKSGSIGLSFGEERTASGTAEWVSIAHEQTTWSTRLADGEFPNWRQLIPQSYPNQVSFEPQAMVHAIDSVVAALGAGRSNLPVRIGFEPDHVVVSCKDPTAGTSSEATVAVDYGESWLRVGSGEEIRWADQPPCELVAFTPRYFADAVNLPAEKVTVQILDPLKPALIAFDGDPLNRRRLIMPVRTS